MVVGLAEIGDKTQILSMMLAARFLRRLRFFGQRDKLKADRSKRGVRRGRKEKAAQRRI
jgi:putative Ca2+/H+ antiporter (TMEM165/GDT1 family)